ncbi:hypothetical protein [Psychrobacter sp. I-STPA6b]|uniref:hypothetical protein n=1 Tax=Psychrobacter sp. I-STPA6b TaxID=2585718 RepID=UPI001D0CB34E|nr:hypothetical protein [Psychrobacter sp. I-STPA6b]
MIVLDIETLDNKGDSCHSVWNGSKGKIFLDDVEVQKAVYCNVDRGVVIAYKTDLSGVPIIVNNGFVYEMKFGKVRFEPKESK